MTERESSPIELVREVDLDAPADAVWHVLTEPDELAAWLGGEVDVDLEPGAVGRITDDEGRVRQVLVVDVEPGERLAWHWWEDGGELSSVEITLLPVGAGTHLRVIETAAIASAPVVALTTLRPLALASV